MPATPIVLGLRIQYYLLGSFDGPGNNIPVFYGHLIGCKDFGWNKQAKIRSSGDGDK